MHVLVKISNKFVPWIVLNFTQNKRVFTLHEQVFLLHELDFQKNRVPNAPTGQNFKQRLYHV